MSHNSGMSFVISGLDPEEFAELKALSDAELAPRHAVRVTADAPTGFPCRVSLADANPGDTLLLLNYEHQPASTPYRASHAIFVNEGAMERARFIDEVPEVLTSRKYLSVRGFDGAGNMVDADVAEGAGVRSTIERLLENADIAYLHVHYAGRGCYAARVDRSVSH